VEKNGRFALRTLPTINTITVTSALKIKSYLTLQKISMAIVSIKVCSICPLLSSFTESKKTVSRYSPYLGTPEYQKIGKNDGGETFLFFDENYFDKDFSLF
jgi:hypothetical protein